MIPPCDPTILENNPQFKRLYQHLTSTLLHPDGSTRANDAQPARKAVLEELKSCQLRNAKKQIKKQTLRQLAFDPDTDLPDDCRDPVAIVTLYLDSSPAQLDLSNDYRDDADVLSLLAADIDQFYSKLSTFMPHFASALSSGVRDIRDFSNAGNRVSISPENRSLSRMRTKAAPQITISSQLSGRLVALRRAQFSELPSARTRMATTAAEVLAMRAAVLERTVTLLERTKHGAMARATRAKAEHFTMVAHGVEGKLSVMKLDILATIHTPEVTAALTRYHQHLRDTRERLEEKRALALEELKAYEEVDSSTTRGPAKSGPIVEIARRYGTLIREIEEVKMEIQRLNK